MESSWSDERSLQVKHRVNSSLQKQHVNLPHQPEVLRSLIAIVQVLLRSVKFVATRNLLSFWSENFRFNVWSARSLKTLKPICVSNRLLLALFRWAAVSFQFATFLILYVLLWQAQLNVKLYLLKESCVAISTVGAYRNLNNISYNLLS